MPPNVLVLVLDTARADACEPYGATPGSTPTLAQMAASGSVVGRAYATACWTFPSHVSMFTGLMPRPAGLADPHADGVDPPAIMRGLAHRNLAEVLRRAGYATKAISTNPWLTVRTGFDTGFERFRTVCTDRRAKINHDDLRSRARWALEGVRAKVDDGAERAGAVLREWIANTDADRPSFWFVNLLECHSPYLPPRPHNDLTLLARLRAAQEARRHLTLYSIWRTCIAEFDVPDSALERMRHLYARSVRYLDDWLSGALESLDAHGILDETLIVCVSDHGENLGEGGLLCHALSLDDRLLRVPLVATGPGAEAFEEDRLTSLAELPRLIAGAVGLVDHPWHDALPATPTAQFDPPMAAGSSIANEKAEEWGLDEKAYARLTTPFECATDGRFKLLRSPADGDRIVDLHADPLETAPSEVSLAPAAAREALPALGAALEHPALTTQGPAASPAAVPAGERPADAEELADLEDRMRLLGYL